MTRPHTLLHAQRPPADTRPAATVLLLRDAPHGLEVLMTRRSMRASFAAGAYVFPGGGIEVDDALQHALAQRRPGQTDAVLTQALAAIRESFEELGVLLARHPDGRMASASDMAGLDRHAPFYAQCQHHGLTLAADQVFVLAHWTTDRDLPKRFDVPFLVARMPAGQTPVADEKEQFEPLWVRPSDALARHAQGDFLMVFPTIRTLQRLTDVATVDALLQACASDQPWFSSCPRAGWLKGEVARFMEHEPPFGELLLTSPDGQIVHALDWQSEQPVRLRQHLQRLTAPNPGMMTGPGTNSYLVGEASTGYVVIDPGPNDAAHLERLWQATQGHIRWIVCTHSHPDHSPGARPLQALCRQRNHHAPPIMGMPSLPTARADSQFEPDLVLGHQHVLRLLGEQHHHTLRALHTPGHAANHLCLVLEEDGLLFSGDHVLNGSTTVVSPPDGHMGDYLASLDSLLAACAQYRIGLILPAHGHVLGNHPGEPCDASDVIRKLKAHRLKREAKVLRAMQAQPHAELSDWVALAYDDTPRQLWPVAMRSLQAHVDHIRSLGLV